MKVKSAKLRTFAILYAFYKYSDEKHRLNSSSLNKLLAPYGLECDKSVIRNTVKRLREFGVNVGYKGFWGTAGFWLADRPLSDDKLNELIYAVRSNPNLSTEQANSILNSLKPLVTVYQENLLALPVLSTDTDMVKNA